MVSLNRLQTFEAFLTGGTTHITVSEIVISLTLAAILSYIVKIIYVRYGKSLSNRKNFANNFIILTLTTTLIISIVKSSLALSLGLVGALSIVRFRAAIKEPEELAYLFLNISVGLGLGAKQWLITCVALVIICGIIIIRNKFKKDEDKQNLFLSVSGKTSNKVKLESITKIISNNANGVHLKRYDSGDDNIEATFLVDLNSFESLDKILKDLKKLSNSLNISYIDR